MNDLVLDDGDLFPPTYERSLVLDWDVRPAANVADAGRHVGPEEPLHIHGAERPEHRRTEFPLCRQDVAVGAERPQVLISLRPRSAVVVQTVPLDGQKRIHLDPLALAVWVKCEL